MRRLIALLIAAGLLLPSPASGAVGYSVNNCWGRSQSLSGSGPVYDSIDAVMSFDWYEAISYHYHVDLNGAVRLRHYMGTGQHWAVNVVAGDYGGWNHGGVGGAHRRKTSTFGFWYTYKYSWDTGCGLFSPQYSFWYWPQPYNAWYRYCTGTYCF
jgi:hypothetical protein